MRIVIRALALIAPVFAVALMAAAFQAGAHVSKAKAVGFVAAVFLLAWLVLHLTRSKGRRSRRSRQPGRPVGVLSPMQTVLAAAVQHDHLFGHVTGRECAWALGIVLAVVVIGALAKVLS